MLPYCEGPVPHVFSEKSSVKEVSVEREFEFSFVAEFVLLLLELLFEFRFA